MNVSHYQDDGLLRQPLSFTKLCVLRRRKIPSSVTDMGNLCGGSKLQVHVQPSFTYETILDRYIDSHMQELILNAIQLSDRRSSQRKSANGSGPRDPQSGTP